MKSIDVSKRQLGVNFDAAGNAAIRVWGPLLKSVDLLANGQKLPLQKDDYGYWTAQTANIKPGDEYKFVIDNETERPDPASLFQPEGVHGPSAAFDVTSFDWADADWQNPALKDYIFYELHTGTFSPEGHFKGVEEKLDHLLKLGATAIEIMPVAQFPGERNWGYDGVFPFAVQNSYGGPEGLMQLVNACHNRGMAVVLDVVYNHMGPEGNYFNDYGPYFTDKYNTPWGNAINFDDAWCDGVRAYFIENALMWFRDFHIDGLRLDAVHAIKDFSTKHILQEIKEHTDLLMQQTGRRHYLITELDLNDPRFIDTLEKRGFGMDAQWVDEFHHALRVTAGGDKSGYYADFDGIAHLAKAYKDAYVYDGIYSPHRNKTFGTKTDNPGEQFIVFSQNHDQVGNRMLGERTSQLHSFEMQKLLAGAVLVSPYLPMLFMGEEWSEPHPFQYFVSHTDPELVEAVRKGRKEEFKAFHAQGEAPDPQSEETFNRSKLQWDLLTEPLHEQMLNYYKALIQLRKALPALHNMDRKQLEVSFDEQANTLMLHRWNGEAHVVAAMNFSGQIAQANLPEGYTWTMVFNSAAKQWGGSTDTTTQPVTKTNLQPESIVIYSNEHI